MKTPRTVLVLICVVALGGSLLAQTGEPGEPAPPTPEEAGGADAAPRLAPNFDLPGTGDTHLRLRDAKHGPLAMFFYGDDDTQAATRIVGACKDRAKDFDALHAQLCMVGTSKVESHERLVERMQVKHPIYRDERGETQEGLGLDKQYAGWIVISQEGAIVDADVFDGDDPESTDDAISLALAAVRSLIKADAPNFVAVLGEPLDRVRDLATLPDGRVVVLTPDALVFILGDTNEVVDVEGGGLHSLTVDSTGMLYFAADGELRMFHETEGMVPVMTPSPETGTGIIEHISGHASGAIMFLRGGKLHAMLPASGRIVPMVEDGGAVDLVPTQDGTLLLVRQESPYFQILDIEHNLVDLTSDEKITSSPTSAIVDAAGRIFVTLRKEGEILVLDTTGRVIGSFPARGGGVEGTPLLLSLGAGYLDAAVKDSTTGKIRILRFAL